MEEWREVKGYEGKYKVSSLGRVKSVKRLSSNGRRINCKILSLINGTHGYLQVGLYRDNAKKTRKVHQIVAESFLGHTVNGFYLVVNHKDFNRVNNNVSNLEIVTSRENGNKKHLDSTSRYIGVSWCGQTRKWRSVINIKSKTKCLGRYKSEFRAHLAYQNALIDLVD